MWWHTVTQGGEVKGKLVEWVASTLHTTREHVVCSITTDDAHTSAASSRLNCLPTHPSQLRPSKNTESWKQFQIIVHYFYVVTLTILTHYVTK